MVILLALYNVKRLKIFSCEKFTFIKKKNLHIKIYQCDFDKFCIYTFSENISNGEYL